MFIKQISVFVSNKTGRLADITAVLANENIDIRALSVADTTDFGILRLIVSDPEAALAAFKKEGIMASETDVLGIEVPDVPGGFAKAVKALSDKDINLEYAYAFITPGGDKACVIIRVEKNEEAIAALAAAGVEIIDEGKAFKK